MLKKLAAEAIGTFVLVFSGTAAITINDATGGAVTHVGVSLTFGLAVLAMILALGGISGAHINPAVTLALFAARRVEGARVAPYIASQTAGAIVASLAVRLLFPAHATIGATIPAGDPWVSFGLELVMTALLMFVVLSSPRGAAMAAAAGAVVGLEALFGGPISGASMNPARSLGPAVVSGQFQFLWVYLAAPTIGALAAIPLCRCVREEGCCRRAPA